MKAAKINKKAKLLINGIDSELDIKVARINKERENSWMQSH